MSHNRRKIEDELGAQPYEHIHAICGADFFDGLITHSEVAKAYDRYLDGAFLRQGQARGSFEYAGILFEEYRGRVGTVDFTDASKAHFFPVGVPRLFRQRNAPASLSKPRIPSACRAMPSRRSTSSSPVG
jgi:Phage major capsid protein E